MGRRGPTPEPTESKRRRGNPGKRALNDNEPKPKASQGMKPPMNLPNIGKALWARIVPPLEEIGMLSEVDYGMLIMGCNAFARWSECEEWLLNNGDVLETYNEKTGVAYRQQQPEVSMAKSYYGIYKDFCSHFGLTPSARANLKVAAKDEELSAEDERLFA